MLKLDIILRNHLQAQRYKCLLPMMKASITNDRQEKFKALVIELADLRNTKRHNESWRTMRKLFVPMKLKDRCAVTQIPLQAENKQANLSAIESAMMEWLQHFSDLEAGKVVTMSDLLTRTDARQQNEILPARLPLDALPLRSHLEHAIIESKNGKAHGENAIANKDYNVNTSMSSLRLFPLAAKTIAVGAEPIQEKGGEKAFFQETWYHRQREGCAKRHPDWQYYWAVHA